MSSPKGPSVVKCNQGLALKRGAASNTKRNNAPQANSHPRAASGFIPPKLKSRTSKPNMTKQEKSELSSSMAEMSRTFSQPHGNGKTDSGTENQSARGRKHNQGLESVFEKCGLSTPRPNFLSPQAAEPRSVHGSDRSKEMVKQAQQNYVVETKGSRNLQGENHAKGSTLRSKGATSTAGTASAYYFDPGYDASRPTVVERHPQTHSHRSYKKSRLQYNCGNGKSFYDDSAGSDNAIDRRRKSNAFQASGRRKSPENKKDLGPIDLTLDSDDDDKMEATRKRRGSDDDIFGEPSPNRTRKGIAAGDLTREDLLALTGSAESGTSMEDTVHVINATGEEAIDRSEKVTPGQCDFLRHFVGANVDMLEKCTRPPCDENDAEAAALEERKNKRQKAGVLCTVRQGGMGAFDLGQAHLKCLTNREWLNDEVINAYMSLLAFRSEIRWERYQQSQRKSANEKGQDRSEESRKGAFKEKYDEEMVMDSYGDPDDEEPQEIEHEGPKNEGISNRHDVVQGFDKEPPTRSAFFSSFFYALLRNAKDGYNYANVQRWSRKKDLNNMDVIIFPINISNAHWCLAAVYPKSKTIKYLDSLGGHNTQCLKLLQRYMQDEGKERGIDAWSGEWKQECVVPPHCPRQTDGSSCGVFVCCFADCLSAGLNLQCFKQQDMREIRNEIHRFLLSCDM